MELDFGTVRAHRIALVSEHDELLFAIGRALGQDGPYQETIGDREEAISLGTMTSAPISFAREVLGGAFDASGRAAWIEQRSDVPVGGYVPVEIDLRVAWGGELRAVSTVETYNPYFGCRVMLARWYEEDFVFVYREKHKMMASRLVPPYLSQRTVVLSDQLIEDRDIVYFLERGAVQGRVLPSLRRTVTVPTTEPLNHRTQELWLEAPGIARLATWPEDDGARWLRRALIGRSRAVRIELPRALDPRYDRVPREPKRRYSTRATIDSLAVDPSARLQELIDRYVSAPLDDDQKFALMELIVESFDDATLEDQERAWPQLQALLAREVELHAATIYYWARWDADDVDDPEPAFDAARYLRTIRLAADEVSQQDC